jgi:hypothetical protein
VTQQLRGHHAVHARHRTVLRREKETEQKHTGKRQEKDDKNEWGRPTRRDTENRCHFVPLTIRMISYG